MYLGMQILIKVLDLELQYYWSGISHSKIWEKVKQSSLQLYSHFTVKKMKLTATQWEILCGIFLLLPPPPLIKSDGTESKY